jgi:hypothetical protein
MSNLFFSNINNFFKKKSYKRSWTTVTHACNPSYSEGTDQEDHSSKPAWANSSEILSPKKTKQKKTH